VACSRLLHRAGASHQPLASGKGRTRRPQVSGFGSAMPGALCDGRFPYPLTCSTNHPHLCSQQGSPTLPSRLTFLPIQAHLFNGKLLI
jgi:hypothetical protein